MSQKFRGYEEANFDQFAHFSMIDICAVRFRGGVREGVSVLFFLKSAHSHHANSYN